MDKERSTQSPARGYGYMIVRVTTARGAIPLEGAIVSVHGYAPEFEVGRGDTISVHKTNSSGLTDRITLPAPPRELSQSPGNGKSYESYNLYVSSPGYYKKEYVGVPVFEGITAIQNVDMIPLPDNGQTDNFRADDSIIFENENPRLESKNGLGGE